MAKPKLKTQAKRLRKGISGAIISMLVGLALTAAVSLLAGRAILPGYSVTVCGLVNIVLNVLTVKSLRYGAVPYTIGWLFGSIIFIGIMGPWDIAFNIAGPIAVLLIRVWQWMRSGIRTPARKAH